MKKGVLTLTTLGVVGGTALGLSQFGNSTKPHAIGQAATAFGQETPVLTLTTPQPVCQSLPGKAWGTPAVFHYNRAILKPTRIEHYCVSYPAVGGTLVKVSITPVSLP